ncbi:MAG: ABC transporter ATP-binding protein [Angelakisella sp.]
MSDQIAAVAAKAVTYRYPYGKRDILTDAEFTLYQGEFTAITGENGAGKTTLGKLAAGILKPTHGEVLLYGKSTASLRLPQVAEVLCYCFQNPSRQLFAETVEEEIAFALRYKKYSQTEIDHTTDEMLELFGLSHLRNAYPLHLSGGEQQRLAIAAGLALRPRFLLLDEPTSGLDSGRIEAFSALLQKLIHEEGIGVAAISHDAAFIAANAHRQLVVKGGAVYAEES